MKLDLPLPILHKLIVRAVRAGGQEYWDRPQVTDWQADEKVVQAAVLAGFCVDTPLWYDNGLVDWLFGEWWTRIPCPAVKNA